MASLIHKLPFGEYLALDAVHFSTLHEVAVSPLHYRRAVAFPRTDTLALRMGRLVHMRVLTPDEPADVAFWDERRSGWAWDAFKLRNEGRLIVNRAELATADRMRERVLAHPEARALLSRGDPEVTLQWEQHGLRCRGRIDWLDDGGITELKSTRLIDPRRFQREFAARYYHAQLAHYGTGLELAAGRPASRPPALIVVENEEPHDVAVYRVGEETVEAGRRLADSWLRTVAECLASGRWPGVASEGALDLQVPDWALGDLAVPEIQIDGGM